MTWFNCHLNRELAQTLMRLTTTSISWEIKTFPKEVYLSNKLIKVSPNNKINVTLGTLALFKVLLFL